MMTRLNWIEKIILIILLLMRGWTKTKLAKTLYWLRVHYQNRAFRGMP